MAQAFPLPVNRALDTNGITLSGAKLYFYETGTLTPQSVYSDSGLTTPHANPVVADAGGLFAPIFLDPTMIYRVILKTSADATIQDVDPVSATSAADISFLQSGIGAVTRTVQGKLREVVSAGDFGAVGDGVTDDTAALQAAITAAAGKHLIITPGNYKITSALNIVSALTLEFFNATLLLATQNMDGIVIGDGTSGVRTATFNTIVISPRINPFTGVAAFTSGAAIKRNNVAFCHVYNANIYGLDTTNKLWNGVEDYMATECDTPNLVVQYVLNNAINVTGDGTLAGRSVDCNYDNARLINVANGAFFGTGSAGIGMYRPTIYGLSNSGWGIHINATISNGGGQNYFISMADIEVQGSAAGGIYIETAQKVLINKGWIGSSNGTTSTTAYGLRIGTGANGCDSSAHLSQTRMLLEGTHNQVSACDVAGDATTASTDGITIKGNYNTVASGVKIRQWPGIGISWGSVTPTGVCIGDVSFANNGTDIEATTVFSTATCPVIGRCTTDKVRSGYTAAASLTIPLTVQLAQATGATTITSITERGFGSEFTLQAGSGGVTIANGGNLLLPSSPLAITAFNAVHFRFDGDTYFYVGKSF